MGNKINTREKKVIQCDKKEFFGDLKDFYRKDKYFCILLGAFSLVILCILLSFNFKGHDYPYHIQRIGSIAEELRYKGLGAFPIRIYSTNEFGYGYASPLFYGDIFLYPAAILALMGLNEIYCFRLMLVAIYFFCFFNMYYCAKKISKDTHTAVMSSVLYTFSAYFALDVLTRSAIGESFAFVFMPLACYGFYCVIINPEMPKNHRLFLVFGMSGLILSHLISTVLITISMAIFLIVFYKKWIHNPKILMDFVALALLTACICAYFIFPLLEQMFSAKFYSTQETLYHLEHWKLRWPSWIGPHAFWKLQGDRFPELHDSLWFAGGFGPILIALILIYAFNIKKLENPLMISLLAVSLILILMAQNLIIPLHKLQRLFGFMQFPYRILIICTLFMSISGAYAIYILKNRHINMLLLITSILSCMMIVVTSYKIIKLEIPNTYSEYSLTSDQIGNGEYIPGELVDSLSNTKFSDYCRNRGNYVDTNHSDVTYSFYNDGHGKIELEFSGNNYNDSSFELPLLMYKGYSAVDKQTGKHYTVAASEHGLAEVFVGDEQSACITVRYTGTAIQKISDIITILTLILVAVYFWDPKWLNRLKTNKVNSGKSDHICR